MRYCDDRVMKSVTSTFAFRIGSKVGLKGYIFSKNLLNNRIGKMVSDKFHGHTILYRGESR